MTVTFDDDPEIVVGGDDFPHPSAPPVAVAVATPIGGNNNNTTTTTSSQQATIPLSTGDGTIERSINQDGSLSVKVTTTITENDGYREIKTEYFHIPSNMANTVMLSLDAGCPPIVACITNMQQRAETTISNATPIPARAEVINNNSNPTTATTNNTGGSSPAYTPRFTPRTYTRRNPFNNGNQQPTTTQTVTTGTSENGAPVNNLCYRSCCESQQGGFIIQ